MCHAIPRRSPPFSPRTLTFNLAVAMTLAVTIAPTFAAAVAAAMTTRRFWQIAISACEATSFTVRSWRRSICRIT